MQWGTQGDVQLPGMCLNASILRTCGKARYDETFSLSCRGIPRSRCLYGREGAQVHKALDNQAKKSQDVCDSPARIVIRPPNRSASTDRCSGVCLFYSLKISVIVLRILFSGHIDVSGVASNRCICGLGKICFLLKPSLHFRTQKQSPSPDTKRGRHGQAQAESVTCRVLGNF